MRQPARHGRRDANHGEICAALERVGCSVQDLSRLGEGAPDLLVCRHGVLYLMEIKTAEGDLNPVQRAWHLAWRGPVHVVRSVAEALAVLGIPGPRK